MIRSLLAVLLASFATTPVWAQCNGTTYIEGGQLVTHSNGSGYSYGGTAALVTSPSPDYSSPMYTWGPGFLPGPTNYIMSNYSSASAATLAGVLGRLQSKAAAIGVPIVVYNPAIGNVLARLSRSAGCVQIIHGLLPSNTFATVILPPYWTDAVGQPRYPVVVSSNYDVIDNLFGPNADLDWNAGQLINWVANSALGGPGFKGAIGVVWNGGASQSSVTSNPAARVQFADVINMVYANVNADRNKIVMGGASRGGVATLMMASNPENYAYKISYALAANPGTRLGLSTELISATLAKQLEIGWPSIGFRNAWLPSFLYPAWGVASMANRPSAEAMRVLISGDPSITNNDTDHSPIGNKFIYGSVPGGGLLGQGTQVVLVMGSHDEYVPFGTKVEYLNALRGAGVPTEAHIIARGGHTSPPGHFVKLYYALRSYFDPAAPVSWRQAASGTSRTQYYAINRTTGAATWYSNETTSAGTLDMPFNLEVPRTMYAGMNLVLLLSGKANTSYTITSTVNGVPWTPLNGNLGPTGFAWHIIPTAAGSGGWINYTGITLNIPGFGIKAFSAADLANVPAQTPTPVATYLSPSLIPNVSGATLWNALRAPYCSGPAHPDFPAVPSWCAVGAYSEVNWGVSEK